MSEKIRRQKDIIKNSTQSYLEATKAYQNYFDGSSPIEITYYQIADEASRTDTSLEDTREVIGTESSIYYNRIKHVRIYGTSPLDINNQLTQRGLESFITGDFVMTPDLNINPRSGEFFAFEDENMKELSTHLFIITDVQYDRATSQKFYKCSYKLYPADTDNIFSHVVGKYVYDPNGIGNSNGVGDSVLVTEEAEANKNAILTLTDGLIDKFEELFYDEGMDTFVYQKALDNSGSNFEYYWSPYICHFIYKNKILEKTQRDFLTEIYVQDINEREYPAIYSEKGYRTSIFHAVEVEDLGVLDSNVIYGTLMEVSAYDLNKPLNLPFFTTAEKFHLLDVYHPYNIDFWMGAFDWVNSDEDHLIEETTSFTLENNESLEEGVVSILEQMTEAATGRPLLDGETLSPLANLMVLNFKNYGSEHVDSIIKIENGDAHPVDLKSVLENYASSAYASHNDMFKTIGAFLAGHLSLTQSYINSINEEYYENNIQTYILLPILIYVLKHYKGE